MQGGSPNGLDPADNFSSPDDNVLMGGDVDAGYEGSARVAAPSPPPAHNAWLNQSTAKPARTLEPQPGGSGPLAAYPRIDMGGSYANAPPPTPPPVSNDATAALVAGAALAMLAAAVFAARSPKLRALDRRRILAAASRHAEAMLCLGLAVCAGGIFLRYTVDEYSPGPAFLLRQGYVAFAGAILSVAGLYLWLTRPRLS